MIVLACMLSAAVVAQAQENKKVPSVELKDLEGNSIDTGSLENDGNPIVICFWATWCSPCKRELNNMADIYEDWQDETGVKIYAVTIDDSRTKSRVLPTVNTAGWEYEILLDPNKEFARAMNMLNPPHTFLLDGDGNIVYQHNNYADGDEDHLYEEILKLVE